MVTAVPAKSDPCHAQFAGSVRVDSLQAGDAGGERAADTRDLDCAVAVAFSPPQADDEVGWQAPAFGQFRGQA